jgi:hypothetical protein
LLNSRRGAGPESRVSVEPDQEQTMQDVTSSRNQTTRAPISVLSRFRDVSTVVSIAVLVIVWMILQ